MDPGDREPSFGSRQDWRKFWADHSNCGGTWTYINDPACPRVVCSCAVQDSPEVDAVTQWRNESGVDPITGELI